MNRVEGILEETKISMAELTRSNWDEDDSEAMVGGYGMQWVYGGIHDYQIIPIDVYHEVMCRLYHYSMDDFDYSDMIVTPTHILRLTLEIDDKAQEGTKTWFGYNMEVYTEGDRLVSCLEGSVDELVGGGPDYSDMNRDTITEWFSEFPDVYTVRDLY